jgi:hypothetical protein
MDREAGRPPITLTAVVIMPRGFGELAGALAGLDGQTCRERIEMVLVHTGARRAEIERSRFSGFRAFREVVIARIPTVASAFAAACRAATGDVVALVEDHVLLDPRWAEATLDAHQHDCAAVAPLMSNGNPATAASWANFVVSFHDAIGGARPGPVPCGPGHNMSYKREVLLRYGSVLETLYQSERAFHYRLQQDGHVIWHAPDARLAHLNISRGWQAVRHSFLGGAMFGQYRSRAMTIGERVSRTVGAPLVPLVRFGRIVGTLRASAVGLSPAAAKRSVTGRSSAASRRATNSSSSIASSACATTSGAS